MKGEGVGLFRGKSRKRGGRGNKKEGELGFCSFF